MSSDPNRTWRYLHHCELRQHRHESRNRLVHSLLIGRPAAIEYGELKLVFTSEDCVSLSMPLPASANRPWTSSERRSPPSRKTEKLGSISHAPSVAPRLAGPLYGTSEALLLLDDTGTVGARDGRALQSCSPALAGIIGGLRWWTALMISALSIPWR